MPQVSKNNSTENKKYKKKKTAYDLEREFNASTKADIFNKEDFLEKERAKIKAMSDKELAEWIIEQHEQYTTTIDWSVQQGFLNNTDKVSRYMISLYINELFVFLEMREIETFSKEVENILLQRNQSELLSILNVLNYI